VNKLRREVVPGIVCFCRHVEASVNTCSSGVHCIPNWGRLKTMCFQNHVGVEKKTRWDCVRTRQAKQIEQSVELERAEWKKTNQSLFTMVMGLRTRADE
jgi:hypothetical protein